MRSLILFTVFLTFCVSAFAVRQCYVCTNCDESHLEDYKTQCRGVDEDVAYLCESRTEDGQTKKSCILNNNENIEACDRFHLEKEGASCYHCDRELCNSATISSASMIFSSIVAFLLLKYV